MSTTVSTVSTNPLFRDRLPSSRHDSSDNLGDTNLGFAPCLGLGRATVSTHFMLFDGREHCSKRRAGSFVLPKHAIPQCFAVATQIQPYIFMRPFVVATLCALVPKPLHLLPERTFRHRPDVGSLAIVTVRLVHWASINGCIDICDKAFMEKLPNRIGIRAVLLDGRST